MKFKFIFSVLIFPINLNINATTIPEREPDIKSVPAKLEDYYTYDKETGKWIWTDEYVQIKNTRITRLIAIKAKKQKQKQEQKKQEGQKEQERQNVQSDCTVQTEIQTSTPIIQKLKEVTPETPTPVENKKPQTKELRFYERWWLKIKKAYHKDMQLLKNLTNLK